MRRKAEQKKLGLCARLFIKKEDADNLSDLEFENLIHEVLYYIIAEDMETTYGIHLMKLPRFRYYCGWADFDVREEEDEVIITAETVCSFQELAEFEEDEKILDGTAIIRTEIGLVELLYEVYTC